MPDINHTTRFYRQRFRSKEAQYNVQAPLVDYLQLLIGDKKKVRIAEVGAGPINTIGNHLAGVELEIFASDLHANEYKKFWEHHGKLPIIPVVYENMEHLSYPDGAFDIVHCVNALDHSVNADLCLKELMRVCKKGGYVYLRHHPNQRSLHGREHRWDCQFIDAKCAFIGRHMSFFTEDFGDFGSFTTGNEIVSIWQNN